MLAKIARSTPSTIVRVAQGDGSRPNLVSVLQEGDKSANIYVRSGAIWRILAHMTSTRAKACAT
jgi:hypothetical protein